MVKLISRIIFFISACSYLNVNGQDPHFSQYFNTPLYVNPANAGNGIEYMRATLVYRNQWASVASPFVTEGFLIDKTVNRLGFGFFAVKNSAGKSSLKQLNLAGTLNYNLPLGETNQISGALQIGMLHKSFNPSEMTFDSQFNEDTGFDPTVSSGEIFTYTSITRPDVGIGIMWQHGFGNKKINFKPYGGFSIAHINNPSETFIISENKLPAKYSFNFGAGIMLKENLELRPSVLYMAQDHFHEFNFGTVASFIAENNNKFQVGLYDRSNDAIIVYAGYQVSRIFIGTSYDINVSGLSPASHSSGGFEISLSFIPKAPPKKSKSPQPKKAQKITVHKTTQKVQKVEKKISAASIGQTVNIPEKIEVVRIQPPVGKPVVEQKSQEQTPSVIVLPEEPKPIAAEGIKTVTSKEKVTEPEPKAQEAPLEFSSAIMATTTEKKAETPSEKSVTAEVVLPKSHTIYIDMNKPGVEKENGSLAENKNADTDGDGINDIEDHCPFIKGGIKTQGCPDSDGDGIQDMMDECPMEPGTMEHFGCPEKTPAVNEAMLIKKFNNIQFQTGSSKIKTTDMFDIIEYAIDLLYQFPNSRVILSGHTDSEGNDLFNMHLAEKRNLIVKNYMMKKGISGSRIQIINYGETMPLDNNTSTTGRARNRRVEVNILKN
ncbi:MAG: PorP/SprF family type IX secretion system membrane protein [Bacteroidia bacterium]